MGRILGSVLERYKEHLCREQLTADFLKKVTEKCADAVTIGEMERAAMLEVTKSWAWSKDVSIPDSLWRSTST